MKRYTFGLDNKQKTTCPGCGHRRSFSPYVNLTTRQPVDAASCGKCDRLYNCNYHLTPSDYFRSCSNPRAARREAAGIRFSLDTVEKVAARMSRPLYAPWPGKVELSLTLPKAENPLYTYLHGVSAHIDGGAESLDKAFTRYGTGTSGLWGGACVFWLYDSHGKAVDGKIMAYNRATGKRIKEPRPLITWDSALRSRKEGGDYDVPVRPVFGAHLPLTDTARIVIVESEKTALILATAADLVGADMTVLATGGSNGMTEGNIAWLRNLTTSSDATGVVLVPDNGMFGRWQEIAARIGSQVDVSTVMESSDAIYRAGRGADIGDLMLQAFCDRSAGRSIISLLDRI